jgi:hypothetical protein
MKPIRPKAGRPKIDVASWNAALDAAVALLGKGYTFVRRPYDPKTNSYTVEIHSVEARVNGEKIYYTRCWPDDESKDIAALMSLKKRAP